MKNLFQFSFYHLEFEIMWLCYSLLFENFKAQKYSESIWHKRKVATTKPYVSQKKSAMLNPIPTPIVFSESGQ